MRRILSRTGLLVALVVALTGCIKVDEDLVVRKDGKVDGTVIIAFSKEFIGMMDGFGSSMNSDSKSKTKTTTFEDQMRNPEQPKDLPKGATAKATFYKEGDWIGNKITFKGVPADKLDELDTTSSAATGGSSSESQTFELTKQGNDWHFRMVMDMSSAGGETTTTVKGQKAATAKKGATTTAPAFDMSAMFANMKADIRIKVTFPGKVIKSNGKVKGNSVTWTPEMGKRVVMDAIAKG